MGQKASVPLTINADTDRANVRLYSSHPNIIWF
jgi:hypothetical protein